ncbi:MAG: hypothetical protein ACRDI2_00250 [Chloroflexota bacterium]
MGLAEGEGVMETRVTEERFRRSGRILVTEMLKRGFTIRVEDGARLRVGPARLLTPQLEQVIILHKQTIIAHQRAIKARRLAEEWREA